MNSKDWDNCFVFNPTQNNCLFTKGNKLDCLSATDLAANFGCYRFRIMPVIVSFRKTVASSHLEDLQKLSPNYPTIRIARLKFCLKVEMGFKLLSVSVSDETRVRHVLSQTKEIKHLNHWSIRLCRRPLMGQLATNQLSSWFDTVKAQHNSPGPFTAQIYKVATVSVLPQSTSRGLLVIETWKYSPLAGPRAQVSEGREGGGQGDSPLHRFRCWVPSALLYCKCDCDPADITLATSSHLPVTLKFESMQFKTHFKWNLRLARQIKGCFRGLRSDSRQQSLLKALKESKAIFVQDQHAWKNGCLATKAKWNFSHLCAPRAVHAQWRFFIILSPTTVQNFELQLVQTTDIEILDASGSWLE